MDIISFILGFFIGTVIIYFVLNNKLQQETHNNIELTERGISYQKEIDLINKSQQQIKDEFKNIANDILSSDKKELKQENDDLLTPLKVEINNFRTRIEDLNKKQTAERTELKSQIKDLKEANQSTLDGAEKLTNALTYDNKKQGTWGEIVLESILENSGLKKDIEYEMEKSFKDNTGRIFRPDVIVHLPDNKDIVIDSKVSLVAYQNYVQDTNNQEALKSHIQSVDTHIKNISLKKYENLVGVNTLDFIFVFFPIEASLLVALEQKPNLFDNALKKNVALVSPSTLMMSLKTVYHIWNTERQNKNTDDIVKTATAMYEKLAGFVSELNNIDSHLTKAKASYTIAKNRLSTGKGNVLRQAEKLKELGVSTTKEIE